VINKVDPLYKDMNDSENGSLRNCLEESDNPRMQNYVKILDTPGISAMEWIHRTQEELMDGIVYLEKLKNVFNMNMRELDAAARIVAKNKTEEDKSEDEDEAPSPMNEQQMKLPTREDLFAKVSERMANEGDDSDEEITTINIDVPMNEPPRPPPSTGKKKIIKQKTDTREEEKPVKKRKPKVVSKEKSTT